MIITKIIKRDFIFAFASLFPALFSIFAARFPHIAQLCAQSPSYYEIKPLNSYKSSARPH